MSKTNKNSFYEFLKFFPELELPIILKEDAHHDFSTQNKPLPRGMILDFIVENEEDFGDEFTEYIPCFQIPNTQDYKAIIYFRANLLVYEYFLMTYSPKGQFIGREKIGGFLTDGQMISRAVATIQEDHIIQIVEGKSKLEGNYEPDSSKAYQIELLEDGHLVFTLNEELL